MKTVTFKEAYDAYLNGHIIMSEEGYIYQRTERKLDRLKPEQFFKNWKILELNEGTRKVKKWNFVIRLDGSYIISEPFEDEMSLKSHLYDFYGENTYPYIACKIEDSVKDYDVII